MDIHLDLCKKNHCFFRLEEWHPRSCAIESSGSLSTSIRELQFLRIFSSLKARFSGAFHENPGISSDVNPLTDEQLNKFFGAGTMIILIIISEKLRKSF